MTVATSNKKVFMELLFWKTSREATEIFEGYGTQASSAKAKKAFWSSEDEDKLSAVFGQVMEMEKSGEKRDGDGDILDQIELMFSCENRSRRQIGNKLRELGLIKNMGEITKKPLNSSREWQEEELEKLEELFEQYKEAENPGSRIHEQWKAANMPVRSKKKLCDKIVELNWVTDRSKLGKTKTRNRKPKEGEAGYLNTKSDSDSALNSSSSEDEAASSEEELNANMVEDTSSKGLDLGDALRQLDGRETATLTWLADTLNEEGEDRRMEFDGEDVPLVAVAEEHQLALVRDEMVQVLTSLGLCAPSQGEQFWRIPGDMSVDQLKARATVLAAVGRGDGVANAMLGVESNLLIVVRGLGAVVENRKVEKKKKKKRGPNKWMPFRRAESDMPPPPAVKEKTPGKEQKKSTKAKNASFLDSSDEEKEENVDDVEDVEDVVDDMELNDENADPDNKENVPQKKTPTPKKIVSKKSTIDKARLLKLLNDDSDLGSTDSDDAEPKSKAQSDTSDEGVVDPLPGAEKPVKATKPRAPRKKAEKTAKAELKKKQPAKKATKKAGKKVVDDESDNDADSEEEVSKKKQPKKVSKAKKAEMSADSSDNDVNDSNQASESDDDVPLSIRSSKKSTKKALAADSSDDETEKPTKKQNSKKKSAVDSSSDEGVTDPTQPTDEPIAAASSDEEFGKVASKKKSMLDSDSDEEPVAKSTKKKMSLDYDSDDATKPNSKSDDTKKETPIKAADVSRRSRSRSSSIDSRRSISPLEDSRIARRSISPLEDSRIGRRSLSPLDDSRLSRRSSFDDSRLRSPVSSPLSRARSSSRSLSPLSPPPHTPYTLAETPAAKKGKSGKTPASKKVDEKDSPVIKTPATKKSKANETPVIKTPTSKKSKVKDTPVTKTPATKRGRASPASSIRSTRSAKKSRVASPVDQSLKLQLSETLDPASQESLKLQLSETLETTEESPIKKTTKKKATVVDSDSD